MATKYPNLFQHHKPLKGKDWLKGLPAEDRQAFSAIGLEWLYEKYEGHDLQSIAGQARVKNAKRDSRGRFVKSN